MDIAALLESHRKHTIEAIGDDQLDDLVARAHDRATIKVWGEIYRSNGELKPRGEATMTVPSPLPLSRAIKPGTKRAKDRARKAVETKRRKAADEVAAQVEKDKAATMTQEAKVPEGGVA